MSGDYVLARFRQAPATLTDQQQGELQLDQTQNLKVSLNGGNYEAVAASQTAQALGTAGALGDYLAGLVVVPATTSPGVVQIKDGSGTAITVFTGGALSVADLKPFWIPIGARSAVGAWQVTTGASVSVVGVGTFS